MIIVNIPATMKSRPESILLGSQRIYRRIDGWIYRARFLQEYLRFAGSAARASNNIAEALPV